MYLSYDTKIAIILGQTGTETETVYLSLSLLYMPGLANAPHASHLIHARDDLHCINACFTDVMKLIWADCTGSAGYPRR